MSQLYEKLKINHFLKGWPVYYRISTPFWIVLAFFLLVYMVFFYWFPTFAWDFVSSRMTFMVRVPYLWPLVLGGLAFGCLWPLIRVIRRFVSNRFKTEYLQAQFGMLKFLENLSRGIWALFLVFVLLVLSNWQSLVDDVPYFYVTLILLTILLMGAISLIIAIYGWLANQLDAAVLLEE